MATILASVLGTDNMDTSVNFYDQTFGNSLDWESIAIMEGIQLYTEDGAPKLCIMGMTLNGEPRTIANGSQLILIVDSDELVDKLHASAIESG